MKRKWKKISPNKVRIIQACDDDNCELYGEEIFCEHILDIGSPTKDEFCFDCGCVLKFVRVEILDSKSDIEAQERKFEEQADKLKEKEKKLDAEQKRIEEQKKALEKERTELADTKKEIEDEAFKKSDLPELLG